MLIEVNLVDFTKRKAIQFNNRNPSGKRITNILHELEFLRAREIEIGEFVCVVQDDLQAVEDRRAFLHLIDHKRARIIQEEQANIFRRLRKQQVIVKGNLVDITE